MEFTDMFDAPICERCGKEYDWNEDLDCYEHDDDCHPREGPQDEVYGGIK